MRGLLARLGAVVVATACTVATAATPAHAAPDVPHTTYAALGDSYSAGVGTGTPEVLPCFRSNNGYPALIADATGWDLNYLACSGATIGEVIGQAAFIQPGTDIVTMTAGGNDIGFSQILSACAAYDEATCAGAIAQGAAARKSVLPGALDALYATVKAQAPDATIVVVGYPRLFRQTDCLEVELPQQTLKISRTEAVLMNQFTERLNDTIEARARANGLEFADAIPAFRGHETCAPRPWINGFLEPSRSSEQFHPNLAGNAGYARLVAGELGVKGPVARATADLR